MSKQLLIVAHTPSPNTQAMANQLRIGAESAVDTGLQVNLVNPLQCQPHAVLQADAIILLTTENLGYMSGALKDFFDRIYYPCLEPKQGLGVALVVRARHDGTGTQRAIKSICNGLRWNWVQPPIICRGEWCPEFLQQCHQMGQYMAAATDLGMI